MRRVESFETRPQLEFVQNCGAPSAWDSKPLRPVPSTPEAYGPSGPSDDSET